MLIIIDYPYSVHLGGGVRGILDTGILGKTFSRATRLRCNLEKQTEENREYYEDLVLKPFTSNCINRIDMPPNIHDLQVTRRIGSTRRYDEHHVTVNACFCGFAGVPVLVLHAFALGHKRVIRHREYE